jgi:hypothetical protein
MFLKSVWSIVIFNSEVSLLIFLLNDLCIGECGVLLCWDLYVLLYPVVFLLWNWVDCCLVSICSQLLLTFDGLFLLLVWGDLVFLFWLKSGLSHTSITTPAYFGASSAWKIFSILPYLNLCCFSTAVLFL